MPDDTAQQSAFWDKAATRKRFGHPLNLARFQRIIPADATILDYGCGHGRLCAELADAGYSSITGVDYSIEMVRTARERHPALRFDVVDGYRLPFGDGQFDAVLLFAVLTCIPSDEAQRKLVAELARVLRPGGWLLVSDYPLQADARNRSRYQDFAEQFGRYGTFRLPDGGVVRHHELEWFGQLLADFEIVDVMELDALTMNGNPARIAQWWARKPAA